jgi:uncharacterized protein (TIGR03000 family)
MLILLVLFLGSVADTGMIRLYNNGKEETGVWINDHLIVMKSAETKLVLVPVGKFSYKIGGQDNETKWDTVSVGEIYILSLEPTGKHKWKMPPAKPPPSAPAKVDDDAGMIRLINKENTEVDIWINDQLINVKPNETRYVFVKHGKFSYKIGGETRWDVIEPGALYVLPISKADEFGSATLVVILPDENAVLLIDGELTKKTGTRREFRTPILKPGIDCYYILEATIRGEKHRQKILVRSNETSTVDFTK